MSIALVLLVVAGLGPVATAGAGMGAVDDARPASQQGQQTGTEQEPNDTPSQANPIQPGAQVAGAVASPTDIDAFTLQAEAGETIRASLTRTSGQELMALLVFGPDGELVSGAIAEPGQTTRLSAPANVTGGYDVVVGAASQFGVEGPGTNGVGEYVLGVQTRTVGVDDFTFGTTTAGGTERTTAGVTERTTKATTQRTTAAATQRTTDAVEPSTQRAEQEPNDAASTANRLPLGSTIAGQVATPDDVDGFAVEVPAGETITAELARGPGSGTLVYAIFGPGGELLSGGLVNASEAAQVSAEATQGGTHYVIVTSSSRNPGTGPYALTVRGSAVEPETTDGPGFDFGGTTTAATTRAATTTAGGATDRNEPNDEAASATGLSPGAPVSGAIAGDDDVDVFAVQMQRGAVYNITLSRPSGTGTFGISFFRPDGSFVPLNGERIYRTNFADTYLTYRADRTGTHYFVVRAGTGTGPYTVSVAVESPPGTAGTTQVNARALSNAAVVAGCAADGNPSNPYVAAVGGAGPASACGPVAE